MATKKITELSALTTADAADVLAIVDTSGNTTNKITANNLAVTTNYLKFLSGDYSSLAIETKNDAACDTGFTMTADTLTEAAWDGGGASAIVLPAATAGKLCVFRFTAQADGAANITFTTAASEFFAAQTLNTDVSNVGDLFAGRRVIGAVGVTQTVATFGGAIITVAGTHNRLTLTATATNNQTNIGAELSFFCRTDGAWQIAFLSSELGSGALNTNFATSAV
jgi:hypothetical protein|tara:strand:- start:81 stop:752 length:672 start_codon:yes stop_codon:yes gene_type:complete